MYTGVDIIIEQVICSLHLGTFSTRKGMFLNLMALTYMDLLNILPTPKETNKAKIIGRNKLTFSVVSSMITASEKDNLEYPASIAADPIMAYVEG